METAGSGEEAIKKLGRNKYPVVILDYELKDKTGLDVLKYIKKNKINSQVLMVSGFSKPEMKKEAYDLGINKFISKPFDIKDLLNDVKTLINSDPALRRQHTNRSNGSNHMSRVSF